MKYITLLSALLIMSCGNQKEDGTASEVETIPVKSMTLWTNKTELFVEFPALVVGENSRFAAHFTVLDKHKPVREGEVTVSLIKGDNGIRNTAKSPSSPGIFSPSLQPKEAGNFKLLFDIKTSTFSDRLIIHDIIVYASKEDAINALGVASEAAGISFLKEQAWKIDFQTAPVINGKIYDVINTSGVWTPSPGSVKTMVAKSNGVVDLAVNNLTEGTLVKRGQLLINVNSQGLASNNLSTDIASAKAKYQQAKSEYDRKKVLYESKIVPKAEFEKVESNYSITKSNYESLSSGVSGGGKQIRAPFNGYITAINVANGDYVEQGVGMVTVGTHQSRVLKTQIAPSYGLTMENAQGVWYQTNDAQWRNIATSGGSILSIAKDVDNTRPLISVFAKVNDDVDMPEGSLTQVQIAMGNATQNTIIPVSALLEDYGSYSVIVQLSGESFERRPVKIGKRNGENVEILQGLEVGEVVVTKGAYQVKMASMSGSTPAHGHEH
ncbi:efflux RND transporter periplasmic adaptor subunit [Maribacter sp. ACAM166]|uniref:efflux RND transporter periplasmic adaptor subunit n=1 Tax=Maribacter sp. ACAM166 TaxID=2508996 RepID=UPI0010FD41A8|nr:efflux RND transporter periplasmic adaptor subunit [Maribacter sp. ACAM166]TLP80208.1 efflux RND transporter periplasmic adaptor subunit [Maribacter sp. ACAM166]